jgi:hypothetical protein
MNKHTKELIAIHRRNVEMLTDQVRLNGGPKTCPIHILSQLEYELRKLKEYEEKRVNRALP